MHLRLPLRIPGLWHCVFHLCRLQCLATTSIWIGVPSNEVASSLVHFWQIAIVASNGLCLGVDFSAAIKPVYSASSLWRPLRRVCQVPPGWVLHAVQKLVLVQRWQTPEPALECEPDFPWVGQHPNWLVVLDLPPLEQWHSILSESTIRIKGQCVFLAIV